MVTTGIYPGCRVLHARARGLGRMRAFVACPSNELLMHYKALLPQSKLNREMLQFVECVAKSGGTVSQGT